MSTAHRDKRAPKRPSAPVSVPCASSGRPDFMSQDMWFIWLLRGDVRGNASFTDPDAQADFICWWLCYGQSEYPNINQYDARHAAIAVQTKSSVRLPRILHYLLRTHPDLAQAFSTGSDINLMGLLCWYRINGPTEFYAAPPLPPAFIAFTEQPSQNSLWISQGTRVPAMAIALWDRSPSMQTIWPATDPNGRRALARWFETTGRAQIPEPARTTPPTTGKEDLSHRTQLAAKLNKGNSRDRVMGVNLVGYPAGELGIGEDLRMIAAALEKVSIPYTVIDVPFGPLARRNDASLAGHVDNDPRYPVSILCLTAFDTTDLFIRKGRQFLAGTYLIGNWPWELPQFPAAWCDTFSLVDEVWAATAFTKEAFANSAPPGLPIHLMPPAVALDRVGARVRQKHLPNPTAFTFILPFDPHSTFSRKNPIAAVQAFQRAFAKSDRSVALVLRINGNPEGLPGWAELRSVINRDRRITCLTGTLARADAIALVQASDCLVSPHRAEGFGRNIAEAKLLGIPVLATGFSGSTDFTSPDEHIEWVRTPVAPGTYPHSDGLWWAEPSVSHLAARMSQIRTANHPIKSPRQVKADSKKNLEKAAATYASRLTAIFNKIRIPQSTSLERPKSKQKHVANALQCDTVEAHLNKETRLDQSESLTGEEVE